VALEYLLAEQFRCWGRAELELSPQVNLIWGPNGAGKTSLLEAAFLLGRGRSFRTHTSERLIAHGAERLVVFGRTAGESCRQGGIEVSRDGGTRARLDGRGVESLAELPTFLPVQALDPETHKLIEQGPERRRRWLDWAVFHVEQSYGALWARYMRCLRQRNAALRAGDASLEVWNAELAPLGEQLAAARARTLEQLLPFWRLTVVALSGLEPSLSVSRGWAGEGSLVAALAESAERDRVRGTTTSGPHRADVQVRVQGRAAREVLSRGQQKLVAAAMVISQVKLLRETLGLKPLLLLDDPAAELDSSRLAILVAEVAALECQVIVTSLSPEATAFGRPERVFHVEQGGVLGV
jgi:DNA replication and repair protein RecF